VPKINIISILGYYELTYTFDFFNYAGIHRPVLLTTAPKDIKIEDITVVTDLAPDLATATVKVDVAYNIGQGGKDHFTNIILKWQKNIKNQILRCYHEININLSL